jgi:hypothetical protein
MEDPVFKLVLQFITMLLGAGGGGVIYQIYANRKLKAEANKLTAESLVLVSSEGYRQLENTVGLISSQLVTHSLKLSEVNAKLDTERDARRTLEARVDTLITALIEMWNGLICLTRQLEDACITPSYVPSKRITKLMANLHSEQGENDEEVSSNQ